MIKYTKVITAIDLSKYSLCTFLNGLTLSVSLNAELILLNVINTRYLDSLDRFGGGSFGLNHDAIVERTLNDRKTQIETEFLSKCKNIKARLIQKIGLPWEEILATVVEEQASLLIIGCKGRSDIAGVLFGSVAEKVQRHAQCSVLTVRGAEHCRLPMS